MVLGVPDEEDVRVALALQWSSLDVSSSSPGSRLFFRRLTKDSGSLLTLKHKTVRCAPAHKSPLVFLTEGLPVLGGVGEKPMSSVLSARPVLGGWMVDRQISKASVLFMSS